MTGYPLDGSNDETIRFDLRATLGTATGLSRFSTVQRIALACRFLHDERHGRNLAGQISLKLDDGTYWTTALLSGLGNTSAVNLVRIDRGLTVVEGEGSPNPAVRFHIWVYDKRPDIRSIVHTHPPHASALAAAGAPLLVNHMDTMMFHDDVARLARWPGVPVADEEGRIISEALGGKSAVLLANHGILTVGDRLELAVYLAAHLEWAAELQMRIGQCGYEPVTVTEELAKDAKAFTTSRKIVDGTFDYWCEQVSRRHADAL